MTHADISEQHQTDDSVFEGLPMRLSQSALTQLRQALTSARDDEETALRSEVQDEAAYQVPQPSQQEHPSTTL